MLDRHISHDYHISHDGVKFPRSGFLLQAGRHPRGAGRHPRKAGSIPAEPGDIPKELEDIREELGDMAIDGVKFPRSGFLLQFGSSFYTHVTILPNTFSIKQFRLRLYDS